VIEQRPDLTPKKPSTTEDKFIETLPHYKLVKKSDWRDGGKYALTAGNENEEIVFEPSTYTGTTITHVGKDVPTDVLQKFARSFKDVRYETKKEYSSDTEPEYITSHTADRLRGVGFKKPYDTSSYIASPESVPERKGLEVSVDQPTSKQLRKIYSGWERLTPEGYTDAAEPKNKKYKEALGKIKHERRYGEHDYFNKNIGAPIYVNKDRNIMIYHGNATDETMSTSIPVGATRGEIPIGAVIQGMAGIPTQKEQPVTILTHRHRGLGKSDRDTLGDNYRQQINIYPGREGNNPYQGIFMTTEHEGAHAVDRLIKAVNEKEPLKHPLAKIQVLLAFGSAPDSYGETKPNEMISTLYEHREEIKKSKHPMAPYYREAISTLKSEYGLGENADSFPYIRKEKMPRTEVPVKSIISKDKESMKNLEDITAIEHYTPTTPEEHKEEMLDKFFGELAKPQKERTESFEEYETHKPIVKDRESEIVVETELKEPAPSDVGLYGVKDSYSNEPTGKGKVWALENTGASEEDIEFEKKVQKSMREKPEYANNDEFNAEPPEEGKE
jgi:hypothetical protein